MTFYSEVFSTLSSFSRKGESVSMSMQRLYATLRGNNKLPARAVTQGTGVVDLGDKLHGLLDYLTWSVRCVTRCSG